MPERAKPVNRARSTCRAVRARRSARAPARSARGEGVDGLDVHLVELQDPEPGGGNDRRRQILLAAPRRQDELEAPADAARDLGRDVARQLDLLGIERVRVVPDDDAAMLQVVDDPGPGLGRGVHAPVGDRLRRPVRAGCRGHRGVRIRTAFSCGSRRAAVDALADVRLPVQGLDHPGARIAARAHDEDEDHEDRAHQQHAADRQKAPVGECRPGPLVEAAVQRVGAGALTALDAGGSSLGHWRGRIAEDRLGVVAPDLLVARIVEPRLRARQSRMLPMPPEVP